MKHPDFDKAFAPTPEIARLSIEAAFRKGEKAMKLRHKITAMVSAAAVLAIVCAAAVFALPNEPRPDVVSQPRLSNETEPTVSPTEAPAVYYTLKGVYYHNIEDCSGMLGAESHALSEAQADGKLACPVCVLGKGETDWFADEALAADDEPQPADHMCTIGQEYFMEIFDHGLFATFPHVDMEGSGKQTDDYIWEEAVYTNDQGLYLAVYREMNKDTLMSGRIALMFPEDFDHGLFSGEGAEWYRNTYALAMKTLINMPMNSQIDKLSGALKQVYVYFDGEVRPNVCEMEFETDGGFFSLSFDINGNEVSLASMNYNVSRA